MNYHNTIRQYQSAETVISVLIEKMELDIQLALQENNLYLVELIEHEKKNYLKALQLVRSIKPVEKYYSCCICGDSIYQIDLIKHLSQCKGKGNTIRKA